MDQEPLTNNEILPDSSNELPTPTYRAYASRWVIVFVLALLNCTSAYLWISFAPVADHFVSYYSTNETTLNWIQLIFPISTIVLGLPSCLLVDWFGVRFVTWFSAIANFFCGLLRVLTSVNVIWQSHTSRMILLISGQIIASAAQPLCMFAPTKLALDWFPDGERTMANTIGSLGNSFDVLLGSALAPVFVKKPEDIQLFNYVSLGLVCFGLLVTVVFVRRNKPLTPPSTSADIVAHAHRNQAGTTIDQLRSFMQDVAHPFHHLAFYVIMFSFALALAYFTTLSTLFQQILCAKGYSNEYAGLSGSFMIVSGLIASGFSAFFADWTGLVAETVKVCFVMAALGTVGLSIALHFPNQAVFIMVCVVWIGAFGFSQYSLALELAAEVTFPVPGSITTGLMIMLSQLLSVIFVFVVQAAATDASSNPAFIPTCGPSETPKDYGLPLMILCGLLTLVGIIQLFTLRVQYRRRLQTTSRVCLHAPVITDENVVI